MAAVLLHIGWPGVHGGNARGGLRGSEHGQQPALSPARIDDRIHRGQQLALGAGDPRCAYRETSAPCGNGRARAATRVHGQKPEASSAKPCGRDRRRGPSGSRVRRARRTRGHRRGPLDEQLRAPRYLPPPDRDAVDVLPLRDVSQGARHRAAGRGHGVAPHRPPGAAIEGGSWSTCDEQRVQPRRPRDQR